MNNAEPPVERLGVVVVSIVLALVMPVLSLLAWQEVSTVAESSQALGEDPFQSIGVFLGLMFIGPITALFSIVFAISAYRQSFQLGKRLAIIAFVINVIGIVAVVLVAGSISRLQGV